MFHFNGFYTSKMERLFFVAWLVFSSLQVSAAPALTKGDTEILSLHVDSKVTSRFARTVITSSVVNRADASSQVFFEIQTPKTAFITKFSMTIDAETYPGIIKEKQAAQDQYDAAISQGQSAGLVKSSGRNSEQFQVSVNVAAGGNVSFMLVYEELLIRKLGKYELMFKVKPKQLVNQFQIDVDIFEPQGISFIKTESTFITNELRNALEEKVEETKAHISFKPTITQQRRSPEREETLLDGDFIIHYDVKRSAAGDIQIVNGYFVHYFVPSNMPPIPKNVIFVIDKSGSMSGKKMQQTREAMKKILEDLNPEDHFNFVVFSRDVDKWQQHLLKATEENVEQAKLYVETIRAQGATDINAALLTAMNLLDEATTAELLPDKSVSMIILLTDGQPTSGVTNVNEIQANIKKANEGKYFLYCLGFGYDVSYSFLEKMALENKGIARRIYEDSDAALQLQGFYHEVATPILKQIEMTYPDNAVLDVTQNSFNVLFDGSEIVVAGKLENEIKELPVEIKAETHSNDLILKEIANVTEKENIFQDPEYIFGDFIERLWAYLTIQQELEKAVSADAEQQQALNAHVLQLSLSFSFVTPLTSMVVTKPDAEDVANKPTEADNENLRGGSFSSSRLVQSQSRDVQFWRTDRARGKGLPGPPGPPGQPAPAEAFLVDNPMVRFAEPALPDFSISSSTEYPLQILHIPGEEGLICLRLHQPPQTSINLLSDPEKGIQVNGMLRGNSHFLEFEVTYAIPHVHIRVTRSGIVLRHQNSVHSFPWTKTASLTLEGLGIIVEKEKSLSLSGPENITINIYYMKPPLDFLGLYFQNSENFSDRVTGLVGQFFFNTQSGGSLAQNLSGKKTFLVQGQPHNATRETSRDYRVRSPDNTVTCWSLNLTS
ncbi:inter-alpha-trypsin inhibitor heavy chain H4-like isoform X2 [Varanus komodoensis]|uniref:inter-alpha-trypsin inhibitor heavy chain H4-like isoform X2 n=1 Tax=Varanus komodoensis TaxID=61221 RepID=UPI001CF77F53|nr:inter-alpha-trypsin inhibitor heavy chain H4-like isoform X2 [Varanus komodoensis]